MGFSNYSQIMFHSLVKTSQNQSNEIIISQWITNLTLSSNQIYANKILLWWKYCVCSEEVSIPFSIILEKCVSSMIAKQLKTSISNIPTSSNTEESAHFSQEAAMAFVNRMEVMDNIIIPFVLFHYCKWGTRWFRSSDLLLVLLACHCAFHICICLDMSPPERCYHENYSWICPQMSCFW